MMADGCGCLIFLWTALLCGSSHFAVGSFSVKTVTTNECGSTHKIGDNDTYRIIVPKDQTFSSSEFTCAIHFERAFQSDRGPSYRRLSFDDEAEICVDFSRIRLIGNKTRIYIATHFSMFNTRLTSKRYPLIRTYMKTTMCTSRFGRNVTLTYSAAFGSPGSSLGDYFLSWIYVYAQPSKSHLIYYLDGTCRHTMSLSSINTNLTIRSVYWTSTPDEPDIQTCSLGIKAYTSDLFAYGSVQLCTSWDFMQTPCEAFVHFSHQMSFRDDEFNYINSKNYTCDIGSSELKGACVPFEFFSDPVFQVRRNKNMAVDRTFKDGSPFFEAEAVVKRTKKKKKKKKYETPVLETENADSDMETDDTTDNNITMKIFLPLALLSSMCSCICAVSHRRAKEQQQQTAQGGSLGVGEGPDQYSRATTPLTTPPRLEEAPDPADWPGRGADRMAAPPPAYGDLGLPTPRGTRAYDRGQNWAVPDTTVPLPASMSGGYTDPPPPPISDGHSDAPPAYHELFPSHT